MHRGKGLTSDIVFLVGAEDEYIPRRQYGEEEWDARRLLYVSLTRARHILATIEDSPRARSLWTMQERMATDLLPPVKVNKGTAILDLIQEYNLQGGAYLGDDLTDIYAFSAIHTACRDLDFQGFAISITSQGTPESTLIL